MKSKLLITVIALMVLAAMTSAQQKWVEKITDSDVEGEIKEEYIVVGDRQGRYGCFYEGDHFMGGRHGKFKGEGRRHNQMRSAGILAMASVLELTDDQITKLKDIQYNHKMEAIDQKAEMEKAEIKLKKLLHSKKASESDIFAAIDETAKSKGDMKKMQYQHRQKMRSILTDEQMEKFLEHQKYNFVQKDVKVQKRIGKKNKHFKR